MASHFGTLARDAISRPVADVLAHRRPDDLSGNRLTCSFDPWMPEAMNEVKHALSRFEWYIRSRKTITNVDNEIVTADVDGLEIQAGTRFISESFEFGI